jgi:hypothetical protein
MAVALKREHPPLGAMVLITDRGATQSYVVPVERYLGRYFYAGEHRFHVADDCKRRGGRRTWQTAAASVVLLNPEEAEAQASGAAASPFVAARPWLAPPEPVGPDEPTEHW